MTALESSDFLECNRPAECFTPVQIGTPFFHLWNLGPKGKKVLKTEILCRHGLYVSIVGQLGSDGAPRLIKNCLMAVSRMPTGRSNKDGQTSPSLFDIGVWIKVLSGTSTTPSGVDKSAWTRGSESHLSPSRARWGSANLSYLLEPPRPRERLPPRLLLRWGFSLFCGYHEPSPRAVDR